MIILQKVDFVESVRLVKPDALCINLSLNLFESEILWRQLIICFYATDGHTPPYSFVDCNWKSIHYTWKYKHEIPLQSVLGRRCRTHIAKTQKHWASRTTMMMGKTPPYVTNRISRQRWWWDIEKERHVSGWYIMYIWSFAKSYLGIYRKYLWEWNSRGLQLKLQLIKRG